MVESNFEKLLGKNGELVEERKRQILKGAFEIISEHYKDKPKMEAVAQLFKKKLGEEFEVKFFGSISKARFTEYGFEEHFNTPGWWPNGELLQMLLIGKAVIVNE